MDNGVDFKALPVAMPQASIRKTVLIIFCTVILFLGIVLGVYFAGDKNVASSPVISIAVIACVLGFVVYELLRFRKIIGWQSRSMRQFALMNGWHYHASPQSLGQDYAPPHSYLAYDASRLLYLIEGSYHGATFSLYTIQGALKTLAPGYTVGYETILRMENISGAKEISVQQPHGLSVMHSGDHTFVSKSSNVFTQVEMKQLFRVAGIL
jgi:hypothetical protein